MSAMVTRHEGLSVAHPGGSSREAANDNPAQAGAHGGNVFQAAREWGCHWEDILDFSASINPLGISAAVHEALTDSIARVAHYPETGSPMLRDALGKTWGVEADQVIAGNGATELLYFLVRVLRPRKTHLVTPTFSEYPKALTGSEVSSTVCRDDYRVPWSELTADVRRLRPDWLILTHPNNPAGTPIDPRRFLEWFDEERPSETAVLLDESFIDFAPGLSLTAETQRRRKLFVLRSLTKFYALPGMRIGCLVAHPDEIAILDKVREPWQVNVLAEQAALAALCDADYRRRTLELIHKERAWLTDRLARLPNVRPASSVANFVLAHCPLPVARIQDALRNDRILIRNCTGIPGIDGAAFRVAVRTRDENERLMRALEGCAGSLGRPE